MNDEIKKEILVVNGQPVEVAKEKGVVYNLQPLKTIVSLEIKNLIGGEQRTIDLSQHLDATYKVIDIEGAFDIDSFGSDAPIVYRTEDRTAHIMVRLYENEVLKASGEYRLHRGHNVDESTILNPRQVLELHPEVDIKSLVLHCERIIHQVIPIS